MVSQEISNIFDFNSSGEGLHFLKENFEKLFPDFKLKNSYDNGSYNGFGVVYTSNNIIINIGCERNALTHLIEIDDDKFTLYKFDEKMKNVLAFSKQNILFTLSTLKRVIEFKKK